MTGQASEHPRATCNSRLDAAMPSCEFYPFTIDPAMGTLGFARIDRQTYREAGFLVPRAAELGAKLYTYSLDDLLLYDRIQPIRGAPIHYILITAFCCSTLLARYFDLLPGGNTNNFFAGSSYAIIDPTSYPKASNQWPSPVVSFEISSRSANGSDYAVSSCNVIWTLQVAFLDSAAGPGGERVYTSVASDTLAGNAPFQPSGFTLGGTWTVSAVVEGQCASGVSPPQGKMAFMVRAYNMSNAQAELSTQRNNQAWLHGDPPWFLPNLINREDNGACSQNCDAIQIEPNGYFSESTSGDFGVMQINEQAHPDAFDTTPIPKNVYWNFDTNINYGMHLLTYVQSDAYGHWDGDVAAACSAAGGVPTRGGVVGDETCNVQYAPPPQVTYNPGGVCANQAWRDLEWIKDYNQHWYLDFAVSKGGWYRDPTGDGSEGDKDYVLHVCTDSPLW